MRNLWWLMMVCGVLFAGCKTSYSWTSSVPEDMRTIAVPTFRNESKVTEIGAVTAGQLLREIQREGTFKIRRADDAAIEIQGTVSSFGIGSIRSSRRIYSRVTAGTMSMTAVVSVVDKRNGRILIDNKTYTAEAPYAADQDIQTANRDASRRVADDLARQIVDDLLMYKW